MGAEDHTFCGGRAASERVLTKRRHLGMGKMPAAPKTKDAAMLVALQRLDKDVNGILATCGHAVVYNMVGGTWEKQDIEGPLFITSRKGKACCRMVLTNRMSLENFSEDITPGMQVQTMEAMAGT